MRKAIVPRDKLVRLLGEGVPEAQIARMYRVSRSAISQAIRAVPRTALIEVLRSRAGASPVDVRPVPAPRAVDVMGVVLGVLEELRDLRRVLASTEAQVVLNLGQRLQLRLATVDRTLRWAESFLAANKHLMEVVSFDLVLKELVSVLDEVDPALREKFLARVRARGLVRVFAAETGEAQRVSVDS
jgi:hypothetical protein